MYFGWEHVSRLYAFFLYTYLFEKISRLTVVSPEAKKEQSESQKQNAQRTTVCLLHERTFSYYDVITTVDIFRLVPTFKPAL